MAIPGFVDLQVNGYAGVNFNAPEVTAADVLEGAEKLRSLGTAGFLLTIVTGPTETIENSMKAAAEAIRQQGPAGSVLGVHLEGPFISPEQGVRGAHPEPWIRKPDMDWFKKLQDLAEGNIRLVTVAPEVAGVPAFIEALDDDILVAAGHCKAEYDSLRASIDAGLSLVTHFGNGCRQQIDRHDNPLVNVLACPELTIAFIPDGHHLPGPFLRMIAGGLPVERLFVVSDSVHYGGIAPGVYDSGFGLVRVQENGRLCLESDHDMLAGSAANMMQCMNHLASLDVFSEENLLRVGYGKPLELLGIDPNEFAARGQAVAYDAGPRQFSVKA